MATFGKLTDGASSSTWSIDRKCVSTASPTSNGTVTSLTARIWVTNGTAKVKGIIYANSSGTPSTLLATGDEITITHTTEQAVELTFSGTNQYVVTSGVTYWIGYHNQDPTGGNFDFVQSRDNTVNGQQRESDTYSDGPTNPWAGASSANGPIDCYANYTETTAGSTSIFPSHLTLLGIG